MTRSWLIGAGRVSLLAAVLMGVSCGGRDELRPRVAAPQTTIRSAEPGGIATPFVPAGTRFDVEIREAVGTDTSYVGQRFEAYLLDPLLAPDGTEVAPVGALVTGVVTHLDTGPKPSLTLDFETVDTAFGDAPISARLEGADWTPFIEETDVPGADDLVRFHVPGDAASPHSRTMDAAGMFYDELSGAIRVPVATSLRLELTRPLVPRSRPPSTRTR